MENKYSIKIGIKLEDGAAANIKKEIETQLSNESIHLKIDSSNLTNFNNSMNTVSKNVNKTVKSFDDLKSAIKATGIKWGDFGENFKQVSSTIDSSGNSILKYSDNLGRTLTVTGKMTNETKTFTSTLEKKNQVAKNSAKVEKQVGEEIQKTTKHIKNQAFATDNWAYNWSKAMQSFLTYNTVTQFYNTIMNGMKDMIQQVKELDDALVELQKVTDLEGRELKEFVDEAYKAGETVAKTGTEMVEAATAFAKAGYKKEALELGTVAAMYTNIADEEITAADAADMIIAQMKAFNITAADSIHIIDAINEVSNNFAVSSADISRNLGKASAVMANAGNSMEQYIGLMTAATEVTRNASKAANGLKTLTLRLQGMNEEGEEDLEVQAQMEELFQKLGISVYKANGELKNTYEILETLAPVYQTLTNAEKAYVTETIAGKYQAQNAAAILNNWSTAVKATETAMNSAGSAAKENEKVLDSIQGHLQRLSSAWEELSKNIFDSNLLKYIVDFGTTILKIANSGIGQFVLKTTALIVLFKLLGSILSNGIGKFQILKANILSVTKEVNGLKGAIELLTMRQKLQEAQQALNNGSLYKAKAILKEAGIATDGLTKKKEIQDLVNKKLAASSIALNLAISAGVAAISLIISAYTSYQQHQQEISDKNKELAQSVADGTSEIQTQKEELKALLKQYDELSASGGIGDNEETKSINESINKILEDRKKSVDLINGSYKEQKEIISGVVDELEKASKEELQRAKIAAEQEVKRAEKDANKGVAIPLLNQYQLVSGAGNGEDFANADIQGKIEQLKKLQDYITKRYSDENYHWSERQKKAMADELVEIEKVIKDMETAYGNFEGVNQKIEDIDLKKDIKDTFKIDTKSSQKDIDNFIKKVKGSTKYTDKQKKRIYELAKESLPAYSESLEEAIATLYDTDEYTNDVNNGVCELKDNTDEASESTKNFIKTQASLDKQIETMNKNIDSIQTAYQTLSGAIQEYNDNGYITVDTLQSVLSLEDRYLTTLIDENGQLSLNEDAYKSLIEAQLAEAEASAVNQAMIDLEALGNKDNAEAVENVKNKYEDLRSKLAEVSLEYEDVIKKKKEFEGTENEQTAQKIVDVMNSKLSLIQKTREGINKNLSKAMGGSSSSSGSKGGSSSKSEKEWWEKEFDALKDQYDNNEITINEYINSLQNLLGKVGQGTEAWKKINKELQKQKLDKIKDDYNAGRISLNQYIISLQNLQKEYKQSTKEWNNLADAIKKAKLDQLKEQQDDLKSALSAVNKVLEKQIDEYENLKDAADERYDDEIDRLNDLQDSLNDKNDDYERAQKAVVDFLNEQLDAIDKQKDVVENYYDDVINAIEKMNEDTKESIELAEAYEALMNAMTQKTKKVYKEGLGWIWTTDAEAIRDAKKTYDDLINSATTKEIEEQKDKTVKSLEKQIESLQDYIDSWDKVFDKFDNEKNRNLADILLGENWSEMVSNLDPQIVDDFSDAYYELQKNLDETAKQIEELNKQKEEEDEYWDKLIEDLQNYKGEWADVANVYEEAQNALKAKQIIGANWEKEILDRRLDVLENFKNKYNAILAEIDKVDNMSTDQASGYTALRLPGYANGGEVDYTGLAVLHGTPNKPEYVLNNSQMRNLLGNLTKPRTTSIINNKNGAVVNNYSFGDIELPNVTNAQQFANELKSMLNITKNQ